MTQNSCQKLEPATFLALVGMLTTLLCESALAQSKIVPDETLGEESSQVRTDEVKGNSAEVIEGGAQRGANLFHSFSEFNVENGRGAYFANPTAIENIFSRVTGSNPSEILGTLGVSGNADLFLINPNGIIFGENARLDVGGSFVGTTADGVRLGETGRFSASEPDTSNLLTVNPSALFFNQIAAGEIINRSQALGVEGETNSGDASVGLQVPSGQTLALVGGDVVLEGGTLTAAGGRIELGSVAEAEEVSLSQSGNSWEFKYDETDAFRDIRLQEGAFVDVSGAGGGDVQIRGARFEMLKGSVIFANTLGSVDGGEILVGTTEAVTLDDGSLLTVDALGPGDGGDIKIETGQLTVQDGALISASTFNEGEGGDIKIVATDSVKIIGTTTDGQFSSGLFAINEGAGETGNLTLETKQLTVRDGAQISAEISGSGDGGALIINATDSVKASGTTPDSQFPSGLFTNTVGAGEAGEAGNLILITGQLTMRDGAQINAGTRGSGDGGALIINATDSVKIIGTSEDGQSGSYLTTQTVGAGDAGDLTLETKQLTVQDGGAIDAGTFDEGKGGALIINAIESVKASGTTTDGQSPSGLSASTVGAGEAGNLTLKTGQLTVRDGAQISAATLGSGDGGALIINATESVAAIGTSADGQIGSRLITQTQGAGRAGDLTLETKQLTVQDGAAISTGTRGSGDGGALTINATDSVKIIGTTTDGQIGSGLFSSVRPEATGNANNLIVKTDRLLVSDGAVISANTLGQGNAGDVTINAAQLTVQNQGQLSVSGQGDFDPGSLTVTSDNITLDNQSIIAADIGSGSQGNITLNTDNLLALRRESEISTNATGTATGGNITINADDGFIVAVPEENSDITANATQATGGRVFIDATSLYGIEPREQPTSESDITASSELGSEFSGIVEINTPNVDPNRDLVQLPTQPTETQIVQACAPSDSEEQSEFVITGRGGLPPSPEEPFDSDAIAVDWVTRPPQNSNSPPEVSTKVNTPKPPSLVEAQGWIVNENNEIVLIAHTPNSTWQNLPQCQKKAERRKQIPGGQNYSLLPNNFDQNILIASTQPKSLTAKIPERITVNRFDVRGNTVFDSEELTRVLAPFTNKPLSFAELLQARSAVSKYYTDRGYVTSGAYVPLQRLQDEIVKIQVVEGYLEDIKITGNKRLNSDYVSSRIETATEDSLQREELLAALQLLQQDSLIASLSAELEAGTRPGASVLEVEVNEADSFSTPVLLDNRRAPSVGSFRRQFAINEGNLLGFGDNLFLAYSNTEGSDAFDGSYGFPFNASNGTITVRGGVSSSEVVEEPFNQLNILGDSYYYELSLRQPLLVQTPTQEFALGITASRRNSDISSLLEESDVPPSELSPGANEDGETKVSALSFFQEWTNRNSNQVIAARSQFNLGLGLFDATVNEDAPDSRFFAWQGQAQWTRRLARDTLFLLRGGIQLAATSLLPSEQFGLGGLETVRGYRQDLLLTDNAAFATAEFRLPLFRIRAIESVFQLAPFVDLGAGWNNGGEDRDVTGSNALASVGLGLRLSIFNSFTARFDWGIPLVAVDTEKNTWQENGLYFSVEYSPF